MFARETAYIKLYTAIALKKYRKNVIIMYTNYRKGDIMKKKNIFMLIILIVITFSNMVWGAERVSLGFIYDASDSVELVDRTNGAINQVSPTCLNISSKGNLIVTSDLTHEFVQAMKERNILVMPFLSNHWVRSKGRAAIKNSEKLTTQIIETIEKYNLDGINVDIENLTPSDRDAFSEFVRILREKMPKDKILTVSVAANPEGKDTGWQGSYDYEKLGEYSDYLFVMAYDEHSQGGECGPVASLEFVEKSIEYTLNYVSRDKVVLGIPLYGRYWKEGAESGGEAVVIGAVPSIISKNKGIVKYDEIIGEAQVTFSINNPRIKTRINEVTLEDGKYTIWYQNEESIKAKLNLVNECDLLGAGVWALGQEKVDVWEYYKNELNKIPYESEKEEKIREEYEAILIDLSNLEEPKIISLKYEIDKKEKIKDVFEKVMEDIQNEEQHHISNKFVVQKITNMKKMTPTEVKKNIVVINKNQKKIDLQYKAAHINRLCKKN